MHNWVSIVQNTVILKSRDIYNKESGKGANKMLFIKNFREMFAYKKLLNIQQDLLSEMLEDKEVFEIRKDVCNIAGYIAQSQGTALYYKQSIEHLNKAIKWTNILDRHIKLSNLTNKKKYKYKNTLGEIRRILISLKNKLEVKDNEQFN